MLFKRRRRQSSASRGETYRALLESQSDLQRHDLEYGRKTLRSDSPSRKMVAPRRGRRQGRASIAFEDRSPGSARILACPSATQLVNIHVIFRDCHDVDRLDCLRMRATHGATQEMLSWAQPSIRSGSRM